MSIRLFCGKEFQTKCSVTKRDFRRSITDLSRRNVNIKDYVFMNVVKNRDHPKILNDFL